MAIVVTSTPNTKLSEPAKEAGETETVEAVEAKPEVEVTEPEAEASEEGADVKGDAEEPKGEQEDKPKKKGGFQRTIEKLNTRLQALESEKEHWREQALGTKTEKPKAEATPQAEGQAPDPDKFESHDAYVRAVARYEAKQELLAEKRAEQERQAKLEFETKVKTHNERVSKFSEQHDDFDDALEAVDHIRLSGAVESAILESDVGPELMYELAKNPKEYERINSLSPISAARELGRIEAKIVAGKEKPQATEAKTSQAPKPLKTVGGKNAEATRKSIYDPKLSQTEYEQLRKEQMAKQSAWG